jgi:hypothetical protein
MIEQHDGRLRPLMVVLALFLLGAACSDSSSDPVPLTGQAESTPSVSQGPITGFGSVEMNGTAFQTLKQTEYSINHGPGIEDDLREGMRVIVRGEIHSDGLSGRADRIEYAYELTGPVAKIDANLSCLTLLGRPVVANMHTVIKDERPNRFDDADDSISPQLSLSDLSEGDLVEVSGVEAGDGDLLATRIERKTALYQPGATEVGILGVISDLDDVKLYFNLGELLVDYAFANVEGTLAEGASAAVKGTLAQAQDELTASRVEVLENPFAGIDEEKIVILGLVTDFVTIADFKLDGHPVDASEAAFLSGAADDLELNVLAEIEGHVDSGILRADKVEFLGGRVKIHGLLQGAPGENALNVMGIEIDLDKLTRLEKGPLSDGDAVRIRAFFSGGEILATRIEKVDELVPDGHILQGPAQKNPKFPPTTFSILGVTISTTFDTKFEDVTGNKISFAQFFTLLTPDTLVKVRGAYTGSGVFYATKAELED